MPYARVNLSMPIFQYNNRNIERSQKYNRQDHKQGHKQGHKQDHKQGHKQNIV